MNTPSSEAPGMDKLRVLPQLSEETGMSFDYLNELTPFYVWHDQRILGLSLTDTFAENRRITRGENPSDTSIPLICTYQQRFEAYCLADLINEESQYRIPLLDDMVRIMNNEMDAEHPDEARFVFAWNEAYFLVSGTREGRQLEYPDFRVTGDRSKIPQENPLTGIGVDFFNEFSLVLLALYRGLEARSMQEYLARRTRDIDPWTRKHLPNKIRTYFERYVGYENYGGMKGYTITKADLLNERSYPRIPLLDQTLDILNSTIAREGDIEIVKSCLRKIYFLIYGEISKKF